MVHHVIGLDLGQATDYTALVVGAIEAIEGKSLKIGHLERWRGVPYPEVVRRVGIIVGALERPTLVIDGTGVGVAVVDLFRDSPIDASIYSVSIHGGQATTIEGRRCSVPKRDLAGAVAVALETSRLAIGRSLPLAEVLVGELRAFRVKVDPATSHESFSAWREKDHDDLVLAVALAVWWTDRFGRPLEASAVPMRRPGLGEFVGSSEARGPAPPRSSWAPGTYSIPSWEGATRRRPTF